MWAYCSGSLIPNIQVKDTAGLEAATGTVAHGIAEMWLKSGIRPDHLIGTTETVIEGEGEDQIVFEILIDAEMLDYVEQYVDWCAWLPGQHFVEVRVDFSDLMPIKNQGGTADHAACEYQRLTITDLKYGRGIQVFALKNTQALLYAYGFFIEHDWLYDFQEIVIRICQPRFNHFDEWVITRKELLEWAEFLRERAALAWVYDAPRTPSEKACQWCKIKEDCSAFVAWMERVTCSYFDDLDQPITVEEMEDLEWRLDAGKNFKLKPTPIHTLTVEQKVAIFRQKSLINQWFDKLGQDLYSRLLKGEKAPGLKLVQGNTRRSFKAPQKAINELKWLGLREDEILEKKLISPAQAETALVRKGYKRKELENLIDHLIRRSPGKSVMTSAEDKRESLDELADDTFDDLDEL